MSVMLKRKAAVVSWILWLAWDPIGCGVPRDEYESYVRGVIARIPGGARSIAAWLHRTRTKTIGLKENRADDMRVARLIIEKVGASYHDVARQYRITGPLRGW